MSYLKPGTLCMTVGGTGENAGRIVRVIRYTGKHHFSPRVVHGYIVRTVSGRPFASTRKYFPEERVLHFEDNECVADRSNLRPLVDTSIEAEMRETEAVL